VSQPSHCFPGRNSLIVFSTRCTPTNRWSQPLAAVMCGFDFMKQFSRFATLALASGGSAPVSLDEDVDPRRVVARRRDSACRSRVASRSVGRPVSTVLQLSRFSGLLVPLARHALAYRACRPSRHTLLGGVAPASEYLRRRHLRLSVSQHSSLVVNYSTDIAY
jgi:hypothetical protein